MDILIIVAVSTLNIVCFLIGASVGFRVQKGEQPVNAPRNPIDTIAERKEKRQEKEERDKIDTIMRNIDSYNGGPYGQEKVRG